MRSALVAIACIGLAGFAFGCGSPSPTPASIQLRFRADMDCPGARVPVPLTFKVDAAADEDVVAVSASGAPYHVWWSDGFIGGTASERVVRDQSGQIVVSDGDVITEPTVHGHAMCATSESIYVLREGP